VVQLPSFDAVWTSAPSSDRLLLYGNGLSIGLNERFKFEELLQPTLNRLSDPVARLLAEDPNVTDLETAVRTLRSRYTGNLASQTPSDPSEVAGVVEEAIAFDRALDEEVWRALGHALLEPHESARQVLSTETARRAAMFLSRFDEVFTLNLDLLWLLLQEEFPDVAPVQEPTHVHGGLHLIANQPMGLRQGAAGSVEIDNVVVPGDYDRTLQAVHQSIDAGRFPALVLADRHTYKRKQIEWFHGALGRESILTQIESLEGTLFTFGWEPSRNDLHLLEAIARAPGLDAVRHGIFQPNEKKVDDARRALHQAEKVRPGDLLDLDIALYDTTDTLAP
jgi:hypothetical protein